MKKKIKNKIRVGFIINFSHKKWLGGANYFLNLFKCLKKFCNEIEIIILTDNFITNEEIRSFQGIKIIKSNLFNRKSSLSRILSKIKILIFGKDKTRENFLKKKNIDLLSHSGFLGNKSIVPSFPIIWDFQEIHNKNNFSIRDRILRKFNTLMCYKHANKVIVGGEHALSDYKNILKKKNTNGIVLSQPAFIEEFKKVSKIKLLKKYNLSKLNNFIYMPNQFWLHKNHIVVMRALHFLNKENYINKNKINIVCSGNTGDPRHPNHIIELLKFKNDNSINNFHIIGMIPYNDLLNFFYYADAILNPSTSEGWSNTVEQAKSFGKKIILSNIPSHLEQKNNKCMIFNYNDYKYLAFILKKITKHNSIKSNRDLKNSSINISIKSSEFANAYLKNIKLIINSHDC